MKSATTFTVGHEQKPWGSPRWLLSHDLVHLLDRNVGRLCSFKLAGSLPEPGPVYSVHRRSVTIDLENRCFDIV